MKNQFSRKSNIIGCPNHWSFHPFNSELGKLEGKVSLNVSLSGNLRKLLLDHSIEAAACSPLNLLRNPQFEMALPLGLVCDGESYDCYFGLNDECLGLPKSLGSRIDELTQVFQDSNIQKTTQIKHAVAYIYKACQNLKPPDLKVTPRLHCFKAQGAEYHLAKLLYLLLFGEAAYKTNEMISSSFTAPASRYTEPTIEFLSCNSALLKRSQFAKVIDLGLLWKRLTGLPFVSMVWQKIKTNQNLNSKAQIISASEKAHARMKIEPSTYYPDIMPLADDKEEINLQRIWKNRSYKLGSKELRSMLFFLQMSLSLEKYSPSHDMFMIELIRWQDKIAHSAY